MNTVLKVSLWGKEVAAIAWDKEREVGVLEYFDSFVRDGFDIAPLMMPLDDFKRGERIFSFRTLSAKTFQGLPGLIVDSLPDDYGNSVIDEWFSQKGISHQLSSLDRLMYIGKRGMGALEYLPVMGDVAPNP